MTRLLKLPALAVLMLLVMGAAVACSDDSDSDEPTPEEAYCESGESLQTSLESLLDLDVIAEGTNGVETAIENVQSDISEFTDAAKDVTSEEAEALEDAFGELESAFSALGDEGLSLENGSAVIDAIAGLVAPAEAAFATLTETC